MSSRRIVIIGVSGCGKSSLGHALAEKLDCAFLEGDDFHPEENVAAMSAGVPLDDEMRKPWLARIASEMSKCPGDVVVTCSALRRSYRDILRQVGPVRFVHLALDRVEARRRMLSRPGHFMNPRLADSQAAAMESLDMDEAGLTLDGHEGPDILLRMVLEWIGS